MSGFAKKPNSALWPTIDSLTVLPDSSGIGEILRPPHNDPQVRHHTSRSCDEEASLPEVESPETALPAPNNGGNPPNWTGRTGEDAIEDAEVVHQDPEPSGTTYVDVFRAFFQQLTTEEFQGVLEIAQEPHSSCVIVPSAQGHRELYGEHAPERPEPTTAYELFYALYSVLRVAERSRVLEEGQAEERRRGIV